MDNNLAGGMQICEFTGRGQLWVGRCLEDSGRGRRRDGAPWRADRWRALDRSDRSGPINGPAGQCTKVAGARASYSNSSEPPPVNSIAIVLALWLAAGPAEPPVPSRDIVPLSVGAGAHNDHNSPLSRQPPLRAGSSSKLELIAHFGHQPLGGQFAHLPPDWLELFAILGLVEIKGANRLAKRGTCCCLIRQHNERVPFPPDR